MKFKSLYIATLALGAVALGACDDNWEQPPMDVPVFPEGLRANMTIAQLKDSTWQQGYNNVMQIGTLANGDSIILVGTVVSSDKSGNIYKKVVIQDATGAIALSINQSKLYQEFPQGAGIAINVTGLYTGQYSSAYQIGIEGTNSKGEKVPDRMELDVITPRVWFDPLEGRMDTLTVDGAMLGKPGDKESAIKYAGRLVRIDNVTFTTPGEQFAPGETTSRRFKAADGTEYDLRSSSYSDFAYDRIPEGTGSIVGILGYYGRNWQIELNGLDGLIGFDAAGTPDTPDQPDQPVTPDKPQDKGGTEGTFNFNDITTLTPAYSPSQEVADGTTGNFKIDVNGVLFTDASAGFVNSNEVTSARLYHQPANDQYPDKWSLRWYNKSTTTFMVAEGYHITKIVFDTSTATYATALAGFTWPSGTFADNTWTPADATTSSVALPVTKTVGFNKITIYYAK